MSFCEVCVSICVGPGALPPLSVSGPGALCVGFRHCRVLCVGPALSVSGRRSLCRAPAVSVSGPGALCVRPGALCVEPRHSLCRGRRSRCRAAGDLCVGPRVGARRSSAGALCVEPQHSLSGPGARPAISVSGPGGSPARSLFTYTPVSVGGSKERHVVEVSSRQPAYFDSF